MSLGGRLSERRWRSLGIVLCLLLFAAALQPATAGAQIARDGTLGQACTGSACTLTGPNFAIGAGLGRTTGTNLFHSFSQFNVQEGQSATFSGPSSIQNIISRVTGTQQSFIDGVLRSTISGANLYLLNPRGVVFGQHASLDVSGSFHVSTADYLRLSDGAKFFADLSKPSTLTVAPPAAFGFLATTTPASIEIRGSSLQVPESKTLSIIGGDIKIGPPPDGGSGASIRAPSGRIQIASVASAGEVVPSSPGSEPGLDVSQFTRRGRIDIAASTLDVSEMSATGGGTVIIRGGQLFVDASRITSDVFGDDTRKTVGVDIGVSGEMALTGLTSVSASTSGAGRSGDILVAAGDLRIDGSSEIASRVGFLATGSSGDITITAGRLTLMNGGLILSENQGFAPARGGNVTVGVTESLTMSSGAGILSTGTFDGDGGALTVSARSLTMDGRASISSTASGDGGSGSIAITVDRLNISDGSKISSDGGLLNPAGAIAVEVTESTLISGVDSQGNTSGIFSSSGGARVGSISLTTGTLDLRDGARIQSGSVLAVAGDIKVHAQGDILIANGGGILSQTFDQLVGQISVSAQALTLDNGFVTTSTLGPGRAGAIDVDVKTLALLNGGQIVSSSEVLAEGDGGSLNIAASQSVTISGISPTGIPASPFSSDASSGIFSTTAATGKAGEIVVTTPTLIINNGGKISVATTGAGNAGTVSLTVGDLSISNGARVDSSTSGSGLGGAITVLADSVSVSGTGTGLFSTAQSTGAAGEILVSAPTLTMDAGGQISVATSGGGAAGKLTLDTSSLTLAGGARVDSSTTGSGLGGAITVLADSVSVSGAGTGLFSTAQSTGAAGEILVSAPTLTMDAGGQISVATSGGGAAGKLTLDTSSFTLAGGARVDSSTTGSGLGGAITVLANNVSLSGAGTGLFSTAQSTGAAGEILVSAPTVSLASGARIDSGTSGSGHGGNISVNSSSFTISGAGSGLFSDTGPGSGVGGDINVTSPQIQLLNGGTISANSTGTVDALAGNVKIITNDLTMNNGSITTESLLADGGNITITTTGSQLYLLDSQITTSVQSGVGGGGNITLGSSGHPVEFIILNGSQIRADAFGGPGGNVRIFADTFLTSDAVVSASSALAAPGTINIQARFTNLSGNIVQLPENVLQAAALLRAACAARLSAGTTSSLVVAGREGVPLEPGGVMPSPLIAESSTDLGPSRAGSDGHEWEALPGAWRVSLRSKCSM